MSDTAKIEKAASAAVFGNSDIAIMNMARSILKSAQDQTPHSWSGGIAIRTFEHADKALFEALSCAHIYLGVPMSKEQVHNGPLNNGPLNTAA